jgi:transposase InsO family protein
VQYRTFGRTGWQVSEIAFGGWQLGGDRGPVDDTESIKCTAPRSSTCSPAELSAFGRRLVDAGIVPAMGSTGDCSDNSLAESFWDTMHRSAWRGGS